MGYEGIYVGGVNPDDMIRDFLNRPPGIQWPWRELSKLTEIDIGSITTVIAGTSHGKTAVAIELARHLLGQDKRVVFWSGEMPPEILTVRMLGIMAGKSRPELDDGLRGIISPDLFRHIEIWSDYCTRLTLPQVKDCRTAQDLLGYADLIKPDVLIIDYIQQLHPGKSKYRTRDEEIESVMDLINHWAIDSRTPVIIFAQINREAKNIEKPNLTSIRHSATVEQYSANVIGLWNGSMARYQGTCPALPVGGWYWFDDAQTTGEVVAFAEEQGKSLLEMTILKSRYHGNVGKAVPLLMDGSTGLIADLPEDKLSQAGVIQLAR